MRKRDELSDPNSCMSKARDGEMTFVLLERDDASPATIRFWIAERIRLGKNRPGDRQLVEAEECARIIEAERMPRLVETRHQLEGHDTVFVQPDLWR